MKKRIGIFAGTFDPIHKGHVAFAEAAIGKGLDKVYFLVEPRPRRKQGVRALGHRVRMAQLVAKKHPKLGVIQLEQAKFSPRTTLPLLQARFKGAELVLLFGDDVVNHMIDHLADWPHLEELASLTSLLIAGRQHEIEELGVRLNDIARYGLAFSYEFITLPVTYASSSHIRLAIRRGEALKDIDTDVADYIGKQKLYASSSETK